MSVGAAVTNPRTVIAGTWNTGKLVLTDPHRFYSQLDASDRLWTELAVLFLAGLSGVAGSYLVSREVMSNIYTGTVVGTPDAEFGVASDIALQVWGYSFRSLLGIYLLWAAFTVVLYAVSWFYSDRGSMFATARMTAWAMVPMFIGNLLKSVALAVASWNAWESGTIEATQGDFAQSAEDVVRFLITQVLEEPVAIAGIVGGGLFILWSGYIAAYGLAIVRDIDLSEARVVVAVPTLGYLALVVYDVLGFAGVL